MNDKDLKNEKGLWLKSYTEYTSSGNIYHKTRAGILWTSVNLRCNPNSAACKNNPTYIGTENLFENFQVFAEWCNNEYGYMFKELKSYDGRFWSLDKDLLSNGLKAYSAEVCMFVPQKINALFVANNSCRGVYPLGVTKDKTKQRFTALCSDGNGKTSYKGTFDTPLEAHKAWQKNKIEQVGAILLSREFKDHHKLVSGLELKLTILEEQFNSNLETII